MSTTSLISSPSRRLQIAGEITTDAKVIPTLVSRTIELGHDLDESVRRTVAQFEGSVAIGISTSVAPDDVHLALRGSGQGVFVGQAEDCFVVASEPYGVVEDATSYMRMDGEIRGQSGQPHGKPGPDHPGQRSPRRRTGRSASVRLRRNGAADRRRRVAATGCHHPRHRPRRLPPLPPEGDHRVAEFVRQDAAGSLGRQSAISSR